MQTTPEHLRRQFRARGDWSDTRLFDLFAANAARVPERLAVVDPPNRAALDGREPRRLDYRELSATVDATVLALAARRAAPRRRARHAAAERGRVRRRVPRRRPSRRRAEPGADAVPSRGARADRRADPGPRAADRESLQGHGARADSPPACRLVGPRLRVLVLDDDAPQGTKPLAISRSRRGIRARACRGARGRRCGLRRRHPHDLLDLRHRRPPEGRAALAQPLARHQLGALRGRAAARRRPAAEPVPAREHGRDRRLPHELAARRRHAAAAPPLRAAGVPAADRRRAARLRDRAAGDPDDAAAERGAAVGRRPHLPALHRLGLGAAAARDDPRLPRALRHRDRQHVRLERGHVAVQRPGRGARPGAACALLPALRTPRDRLAAAHRATDRDAPHRSRHGRRGHGRRACRAKCRSAGRPCSTATSSRRT